MTKSGNQGQKNVENTEEKKFDTKIAAVHGRKRRKSLKIRRKTKKLWSFDSLSPFIYLKSETTVMLASTRPLSSSVRFSLYRRLFDQLQPPLNSPCWREQDGTDPAPWKGRTEELESEKKTGQRCVRPVTVWVIYSLSLVWFERPRSRGWSDLPSRFHRNNFQFPKLIFF